MARGRDGFEWGFQFAIAVYCQESEHTVLAVKVWSSAFRRLFAEGMPPEGGTPNGFVVNGNNRNADFSCRFGNELFEPCTDIVNFSRCENSQFVAAVSVADAENNAKNCSWIYGCVI